VKKVVILFLLQALAQWSVAQLNISTNFRQDAVWNESTEAWDVNSTDEGATFFEFNKEMTMFKHTTPTIESTYIVTEWDYDDDEVKYTMLVKSDAGNEYEMIIDGIQNCVAFFFWRNDKYILVRHTIKETWIKE
jgi:hypothetical protein